MSSFRRVRQALGRQARAGDYIFENVWQSFRADKNRSLELKNSFHERAPERRKIAMKPVDTFGKATMTIAEVNFGGKI